MLEVDVGSKTVTLDEAALKDCVLCRRLVEADGVKAPVEFAEDFNLEGLIHVYLVFSWADGKRKGGRPRIEFRWCTKGEVVYRSEQTPDLGAPPVWLYGSVPAICLGPGEHVVEILVDGATVAERSFRVSRY